MELHGFTSCLYRLHDRLHPASIYYMTDYILPLIITCLITSCLDRLHVSLHAPESITCSRIHYMRPVFTVVNQWAAGRAIGSDAAIAVSPGWRD